MSSLNFEELEQELTKAIEEDDLYWIRNEAKFRATRQGCDYEQFKSIVDASHLNPIKHQDLKSLKKTASSVYWNPKVNPQIPDLTKVTKDIKAFRDDVEHLDPSEIRTLFRSECYSSEDIKRICIDHLDNAFPGIQLSVSNVETIRTSVPHKDLNWIWNIICSMHTSKRLCTNIGFLSETEIDTVVQLTKNVIAALGVDEKKEVSKIMQNLNSFTSFYSK